MTADAGGLAWRHEKQRPALKNVKILTAAITPEGWFTNFFSPDRAHLFVAQKTHLERTG